jgi:hypothetical protein
MADEGMGAAHEALAELRVDAGHDLALLLNSLRIGFEAADNVITELQLSLARLDEKCTAAGDEALALRRDAQQRYATLQRRLDEVAAGESGTGLLDRQEALEGRLDRIAREIETLRATTQGIPALSRQVEEVRATADTIPALRTEVDQLRAATGDIPALRDEVASLRAGSDVTALTLRVAAVEEQVQTSASTAAGNPVPPPMVKWKHTTLEAWVENYFVGLVERRLSNTRRWCSHWAQHPEAVGRLTTLWRSWEQSQAAGDPLALSAWYLDHLDRHLAVLLSADGPFAGCSPQRHNARPPLDTRPVEHTESVTRWDDDDRLDEDRTQEVRIP